MLFNQLIRTVFFACVLWQGVRSCNWWCSTSFRTTTIQSNLLLGEVFWGIRRLLAIATPFFNNLASFSRVLVITGTTYQDSIGDSWGLIQRYEARPIPEVLLTGLGSLRRIVTCTWVRGVNRGNAGLLRWDIWNRPGLCWHHTSLGAISQYIIIQACRCFLVLESFEVGWISFFTFLFCKKIPFLKESLRRTLLAPKVLAI